MSIEKATFGAGCFWGVEAAFAAIPGVTATAVGYEGGATERPTYKDVCADQTGHAEVVELDFDTDKVSYEALLSAFFELHDPTTMNRQMDDIGTEYRSAIFYASEEQKQVAEDTIADVEASGLWPGSVVTALEPAGRFWEAEPDDQDYLQKHPDGDTCHFPRPGWKLPHRETAS